MKALLTTILREIFGLFVDDGSLALAILAVVALVALALRWTALAPEAGGLLLVVGLVGVLAENLRRSAHRLRRK